MVQSRNYGPDESKLGETSINFTANADRGGSTGFQAGSTFKAITLAAASKKDCRTARPSPRAAPSLSPARRTATATLSPRGQ